MEFLVNLITLPICGYDGILGMDWSSRYHAQLDCRTNVVNFCVLGEPILEFKSNGETTLRNCYRKMQKDTWLI